MGNRKFVMCGFLALVATCGGETVSADVVRNPKPPPGLDGTFSSPSGSVSFSGENAFLDLDGDGDFDDTGDVIGAKGGAVIRSDDDGGGHYHVFILLRSVEDRLIEQIDIFYCDSWYWDPHHDKEFLGTFFRS